MWREGEKARGRWAWEHTGEDGQGLKRGPSKAEGARKAENGQEHLTEREGDREPGEATREESGPKPSEAAGGSSEEASQQGQVSQRLRRSQKRGS